MGKPTGFMDYPRQLPDKRPVDKRLKDFREIYAPFPREKLRQQAARCMDCGVPTCHAGCPLGNLIPDFNDDIYHDRWKEALAQLLQTNNFPEFTGRLCPAPCEEACVLSINEPAVTIEQIEKEIIEFAFEQGWVRPAPPSRRSGKTVAVIGSGPAGLACAQQLNRAGHLVTVLERSDRIGGLLRYGIPDFKLEKWVLDRRLDLLEQEGIRFVTAVEAGRDLSADELQRFDSVVLCIGATVPRDLQIPGRDLDGIHFAMDYLVPQNRQTAGSGLDDEPYTFISAAGKNVVVIGGGDTGSDCIGTCNRQKARSVVNFELMAKPPEQRPEDQPWPFWPMRLRTSASHEEGAQRCWGILTKKFVGGRGKLKSVHTVDVVMVDNGQDGLRLQEVEGSLREWPADLVLLALGFTGPEPDSIVTALGLFLDERGNIATDENYMTTAKGVFAAGDARRGQSLIVWAISEGREAARCVDVYLSGESLLPTKGGGDLPRIG
ncbi:MAG: glutamate synthase [Deltaproteobacteria bacterium SG8_13]|nr:MAG: glutamate synthase [Deltaproteobacteria bacterium SG8_13]